jgi:hypothetical protein
MYLFFLALYCLSFDLRLFGLVLSVLQLTTFWPCIVCPSTSDFLALYCLSFDFRLFGLVLSVLRLTTFWPCTVCPSTSDFLALYCLSFDLRPLITPLIFSNFSYTPEYIDVTIIRHGIIKQFPTCTCVCTFLFHLLSSIEMCCYFQWTISFQEMILNI